MRIRRRWRRRIRIGAALVLVAAVAVPVALMVAPDATDQPQRTVPTSPVTMSNELADTSERTDADAPRVLVPRTVEGRSTDGGSVRIVFDSVAEDPQDGLLRPTCLPAPGSLFPVGTTTVTCTATDSTERVGVARLSVVVTSDAPVLAEPAAGETAGDGNSGSSIPAATALLAFAGVLTAALGARHHARVLTARRRAHRRKLAADRFQGDAQGVDGTVDVRELVDAEETEPEGRESVGLVNR